MKYIGSLTYYVHRVIGIMGKLLYIAVPVLVAVVVVSLIVTNYFKTESCSMCSGIECKLCDLVGFGVSGELYTPPQKLSALNEETGEYVLLSGKDGERCSSGDYCQSGFCGKFGSCVGACDDGLISSNVPCTCSFYGDEKSEFIREVVDMSESRRDDGKVYFCCGGKVNFLSPNGACPQPG